MTHELGPLPEWAPTLEYSERAIDQFIYSQEPAGEMADEFRAGLSAVIAEAVAAEVARAVEAEREACAEIAAPERIPYSDDEWRVRCEIAEAIRERAAKEST